MNEEPGESAEAYIRWWHDKADNCELGGRRNETSRGRLIVCRSDKNLSQKLQMEHKLTLEGGILKE